MTGAQRRPEELLDHNASLTLREGEGRKVEWEHCWLLSSLRNVCQSCQVVLKPESNVKGVRDPISPWCPSIQPALVSLATTIWLFGASSIVDLFWWILTCYKNLHIWCSLTYINSHVSTPDIFVSDFLLLFLLWPNQALATAQESLSFHLGPRVLTEAHSIVISSVPKHK